MRRSYPTRANLPDPSEPNVVRPHYLGRQEKENTMTGRSHVSLSFTMDLMASATTNVKKQTLKNEGSPQIKTALSACLVGLRSTGDETVPKGNIPLRCGTSPLLGIKRMRQPSFDDVIGCLVARLPSSPP